MTQLIIVSRRPGIIRGGVRHPAQATHALNRFTPEQLADIIGEPDLSVVAGVLMRSIDDLPAHIPTQVAADCGPAIASDAPPEETSGTVPAAPEGKGAAGKKGKHA